MSEDNTPPMSVEPQDSSDHAQEQDWPGYDSNDTLRAISKLYKTLERMYLPSGCLQYPPSSGWTWPNNVDFSRTKSDAVLDLMQHIPKLVRPQKWSSLQIFEATEAIDFSFSWAREGMTIDLDPSPALTTLPSHVLMIGQTHGRNGHYLFLDTERGTVTVCDFQVGPTTFTDLALDIEDLEDPVVLIDEDGRECTEEWRPYATYPITDFFEDVVRKFEQLELVPYFNGEVHFGEQADDEIKRIFRDCGWPGQSFDQDGCRQRVQTYLSC